ncbi:MAG: DUF4261 domain-containing protein [Saezia sp.]
MSIFSRFFGKKEESTETSALVANPKVDKETTACLQVAFSDALSFNDAQLTAKLQAYHATMKAARCEIAPDLAEFFALAGWGKHVIQMVGFNAPFPKNALEGCVAPAHYPQELKEEVRATKSHILLYYAGYETSIREQYAVLTAVAGVLSEFGAIAVLNESAYTSLPAAMFGHKELGSESLEFLREFPLTMLYCGFVKYDVENVHGVWMRTYGANKFGKADFAALAAGHHEGSFYSDMFANILNYLIESNAVLEVGHTMQIGEDKFIKLRAPAKEEYFLDGLSKVYVIEIIEAAEIKT